MVRTVTAYLSIFSLPKCWASHPIKTQGAAAVTGAAPWWLHRFRHRFGGQGGESMAGDAVIGRRGDDY